MRTDDLRQICRDHGIRVSIAGLVREVDAARILDDVSPRTLREWRHLGIGPPCVRIGGRWRYHIDDLARALTPAAELGKTRRDAADLVDDIDGVVIDDAPMFPRQVAR